ncbi:MAG TPA: metal-dependent phosphohydrolase [Pseudomonas sp.]|nr:metal-dependent phosphohydrolase [Pseudomonas sp.]MBB50105.1 metal-dependent phosphohydrolase [Pseudomonadales bacterium]MBB52420.1 metal-dependent phosphohydrolase [Pseudomonadales bacterium]MBF77644.1 metal-dependent phosphohydrolase [Pseudomonadales bacterium]HCA23088.1 metal-dependent phosphohydrolase [Pseudomonas sp.]|tara:strand:+ start:548 stop:2119 length:1572 start_codon:yes stop_codon:yes gene_type:complete
MSTPIDAAAVASHLSRLTRALSVEEDDQRILEQVVDSAMALLNSDGGTLYTYQGGCLHFNVLRNRSLQLRDTPDVAPIPLYDDSGRLSDLVVAHALAGECSIRVDDAYQDTRFDFSGTRRFDARLGYKSHSFLCVPLKDHENQNIGVLQLINAQDAEGRVIPFAEEHQLLAESLGAIAAITLTQRELIAAQKGLFESFIKLIAEAIDHKSPVTGRHCQKVPEIAMLIADALCTAADGEYADFSFSEQELYELKIAAWLHDCGKITTPESIIEKASKLERIVDGIELIAGRAREWQQALLIEVLQRAPGDAQALAECRAQQQQVDDDMAFLRRVNQGSEFLAEEDIQRIEHIGQQCWTGSDGAQRHLLSADEVRSLSISRGTLLPEEIQVMRDHIVVTNRMLRSLHYPRYLQNVPDIAGNHHEHLDGSGYPRGLDAQQMAVRDRIMCIADIFEALTAPDRPYKQGMKLSQALTIIGRNVVAGRLDAEIFTQFVRQGVYRTYAERFMPAHQIDEPDLQALPGLLR